MKKVDIILAIFSIFVLAYVMRDWILPTSPFTKIMDDHELKIIAIIKDQDCIECLDKTLCKFPEMVAYLKADSPDITDYLIFFNKDGDRFNQDELLPLCNTPPNFYAFDYGAFRHEKRLPAITPSILLMINGEIIEQRPVDLKFDLMTMAGQFSSTIESLRAMRIIE